jgi:peptidoglycan/LPS O-acetylase OafA/YrhL
MHKKQLDGLRFIAFLLVFLHHFAPNAPNSFGATGVNLFFALSGFLITRIILIYETGSLKHDLGIFYVRRTLRIFPVYYLFCAWLLLAGLLPYPIWQFTYLWNIKVFLLGHAHSFVNHFWSLCVEEQFYLSFPPLVLITPKQHRLKLIAALILATIICNLLFILFDPDSLYFLLLPVRGQFLLWGCLAGYLELLPQTKRVPGTQLFFAGTISMIVLMALWPKQAPTLGVAETLAGISLASIVFGLWRSTNETLVGIFSLPPLAYLGKISYGLYLFHWIALPWWLTLTILMPGLQSIDRAVGCLLITIFIAAVSWHLFENPINKFKDRFAYGVTPKLGEEELGKPA